MEFDAKRIGDFWSRVQKTETCWLWTGPTLSDRSAKFTINGKSYKTHRLSFYLHNGYWPEPMCLHSCDTPLCVNPNHLRAGTARENLQDCVSRGRHVKPIGYKLSDDQVIEIRQRYKPRSVTRRQLAEEYKVSLGTIDGVIDGSTWQRVPAKATKEVKMSASGSCEKGHTLADAILRNGGRRRCRTCRQEYQKEYYKKRK